MAVLANPRSWRTRLLIRVVPEVFFWLSHLVLRLCRIRFVGKEHEDLFLDRGQPICFAGLHQNMILLPWHFRDRDGVVMVSASRDGGLIAGTMARFGLRAARGSSGRGGREALDAMIAEVNASRCSAGIIVDGPRGPAGVPKVGAIRLARATGLPLVPGAWWSTRCIAVGSWDRTLIPLPFGRIVFAFEPAVVVPPDTPDTELEPLRQLLAERLLRARATARAACGLPPDDYGVLAAPATTRPAA